jgi:hypothetical protein
MSAGFIIGWCAASSFLAMAEKRLIWSGIFLALAVVGALI